MKFVVLQDGQSLSPKSKISKEKDRKKSIIQAVSDFFLKKSPTKTPSPKETPPSSGLNKLKIAIMGKERSKVNSSKIEIDILNLRTF